MKALAMNAPHLKWFAQPLRAVGPYLLIELLLPGGTLIALLLWLSQSGRFDTGRTLRQWRRRTLTSLLRSRAMLSRAAALTAKPSVITTKG